MKIGKKKQNQILVLSVFDKLFREQTGDRFFRAFPSQEPFYTEPPDCWNDDEKDLFDLMTQIEDQLKQKILGIIEN